MRWLLVVLALAMTGAVAWLLFSDPAPPPRVALREPRDDDPTRKPWMGLKSGTLTVRVRTPDGRPPPGAQVGYEAGREPRLYYTTDEGVRTLGDVPLGDLTVVVVAPGYETVRRRTRVEAGVTEELTVILTASSADPRR